MALFLFFMVNEKSRNLLSKKLGYIYTVFLLLNASIESTEIDALLQAGEDGKNIDSVEEIFKVSFKKR